MTEAQKKWREEHKDELNARRAEKLRTDPAAREAHAEAMRRYRETHREKVAEIARRAYERRKAEGKIDNAARAKYQREWRQRKKEGNANGN